MIFASALRGSLKKGYSSKNFIHDLGAGIVVSLVALPLAMALSIAVGLPPQHGLYTAIIAGIITPLLGGSLWQVSGPTAAFVVILAPIVTEFGLRGIIWCQILAGIIILALGLLCFGRYISYVPYPVTTGFTAGIAVVIGTLSLKDFLGLPIGQMEDSYIGKVGQIVEALPDLHLYDAGIGLFTLLVIVFFPKITKKIPSPIVGISLAAVVSWFLAQRFGVDISTIGSRFHYTLPGGETGNGVPPLAPQFHLPGEAQNPLFAWPSFDELKTFMMPALVIAALGALESLLSATVADSMAGTHHNPNAELNGIGVANILSGLFSGIPATGAIARTATNVNAGAKTPVASALHGVFLLVYMLCLSPLIAYVPMAALSALLLITAWRMSHVHQFVTVLKIAPMTDKVTLAACFGFTVFIDMVAGVSIGFALATLFLMKRVADLTHINISTHDDDDIPANHRPDKDTLVLHITGPLFFGSSEQVVDRLGHLNDGEWTKLVIDMGHMTLIDMTGLAALSSLLLTVTRGGRAVTLRGEEPTLDKILHQIPENLAAMIRLEKI